MQRSLKEFCGKFSLWVPLEAKKNDKHHNYCTLCIKDLIVLREEKKIEIFIIYKGGLRDFGLWDQK